MRRAWTAAVVVMLVAGGAGAQAPRVVPERVQAKAGTLARIVAMTPSEVGWYVVGLPDDYHYRDAAKKTLAVTYPANATILVLCITTDGGPKVHECRVTFEGGPTPPPGPGPGPDPPPVDTLLEELRAAYRADAAANKGKPEHAKAIAITLRQGVVPMLDRVEIVDIQTAFDFTKKALEIALGSLGIKDTLPTTSQAVGKWLRGKLPTDGATKLTPELRQQMKVSFTAVADALEKAVAP